MLYCSRMCTKQLKTFLNILSRICIQFERVYKKFARFGPPDLDFVSPLGVGPLKVSRPNTTELGKKIRVFLPLIFFKKYLRKVFKISGIPKEVVKRSNPGYLVHITKIGTPLIASKAIPPKMDPKSIKNGSSKMIKMGTQKMVKIESKK